MSVSTIEQKFKSLNGQNVNFLRNWLLDAVATDPAVAQALQLKWHSTDLRLKVHDGTNVKQVAWLSDLSEFSRYRGTWDASTGIPTAAGSTISPGTAIEAGDRWLVTTGGTIAGLVGESDTLVAGDFIVATADAAAAAANFAGIQSNVDTNGLVYEETQLLAALPADTATVVNFTTLTNIRNFEVYNGTAPIKHALVATRTAGNQITLQSSIALTNLSVEAHGTK